MKLYKFLILAFAALMITSCSTDYDVNDYFDLEELPAYVAFDADGNDINPDRSIDEGASTDVAIESPTEVTSDITVNYEVSGDAVFGVDYTIDGATASGGTVVISTDRGEFNETYRALIPVVATTDGVVDDAVTLTLTITSATDANGDVAIGRGGKDFQRSINLTINNIDE